MKFCSRCETKQPLAKFSKNKSASDGLQSWCKTCTNAHSKARYDGNLNGYRDDRLATASKNTAKYEAANKDWLWDYLTERACEHCGESNPLTLEFDHIDPTFKRGNISSMMRSCPLETLKREVAKCRVLCANCHRIRTAVQFGTWRADRVD